MAWLLLPVMLLGLVVARPLRLALPLLFPGVNLEAAGEKFDPLLVVLPFAAGDNLLLAVFAVALPLATGEVVALPSAATAPPLLPRLSPGINRRGLVARAVELVLPPLRPLPALGNGSARSSNFMLLRPLPTLGTFLGDAAPIHGGTAEGVNA